MQNMQDALRSDAKKQLRTGGIFLGITTFILLSPFLFSFSLINLMVIALPFFFFGIIMLSTAARDYRLAKLAAQQPTEAAPQLSMQWPSKMYLSSEVTYEHTGRLYDLQGDIYNSIQEKGPWYWKVISAIAAVISAHPFAPRWFAFYDAHDQLRYKIDKKGGLNGRYFVKDPNGYLLYFMEVSWKKGVGLEFYMYKEKELIWQATTDKFMDRIIVLNPEKLSVVDMKKDAIPIEAADRFGSKSGFLLQRYEQEAMPESLQIFLHLINHKRSQA